MMFYSALNFSLFCFSCAYWRVKLLDPDLDIFLDSRNVDKVRAHILVQKCHKAFEIECLLIYMIKGKWFLQGKYFISVNHER